jgi:hypothetical protein
LREKGERQIVRETMRDGPKKRKAAASREEERREKLQRKKNEKKKNERESLRRESEGERSERRELNCVPPASITIRICSLI